MKSPVVIAIDGPAASGKSTNARLVAEALDFVYVDTGAMYRTLAWYCLNKNLDVRNPKVVVQACHRWKTQLTVANHQVRLLVDGYYPEREIRSAETNEAVPHVAALPKVRQWMKKKQRECIRFGNLVMEGRDIGSNVFPETDFKFFLDATLEERLRRRRADGLVENLAARDQRDSQRAAAPLMIPLGATVINNSDQSPEETSARITAEIRRRLAQTKGSGQNPADPHGLS